MNPFEVLGLPVRADLSDAQVRTAWKDIAAKTHPDRPDGGDIAAYTAAATAYAQLRTGWGRSEAYADLATTEPYVPAPGSRGQPGGPAGTCGGAAAGPGPHPARPAAAAAGPRPGRRPAVPAGPGPDPRARPPAPPWSPG